MSNQLKGTLYVSLCIALWALIPIVAKLEQSELDIISSYFGQSWVLMGLAWHLL